MSRTRVLVVDDSVVVRRVLGDIVASDPDLEVAGTAATASIALQKIPQINPDVVLLDVEMPEMDGIEAARRIRKDWPRLPVIMCSSLTERGADVTLRALAAGASDYVAKPAAVGSRDAALGAFRAELLSKIKVLGGVGRSDAGAAARPSSAPAAPAAPMPEPRRRARVEPVSVLAIGSSTGGPNALATLFDQLPGDLPVPLFLVQHMPPLFTKMLADRLTACSRVRVTEACDGDLVEAGRAYVAPGDYHMAVVRDGGRVRIVLNQETPENSCRPAVDVLFRSLARAYGSGVLAAVLTGMGHDGTRGAGAIVEAGGTVIVQDAPTCVVPSMPMSVASAGFADAILPLDRIGAELVARTNRSAPRAVDQRRGRIDP